VFDPHLISIWELKFFAHQFEVVTLATAYQQYQKKDKAWNITAKLYFSLTHPSMVQNNLSIQKQELSHME